MGYGNTKVHVSPLITTMDTSMLLQCPGYHMEVRAPVYIYSCPYYHRAVDKSAILDNAVFCLSPLLLSVFEHTARKLKYRLPMLKLPSNMVT